MHRAYLVLGLVACNSHHAVLPDAAAPDAPADAAIDAPTLPAFRNPVALPDDQLATQALQILGAAVTGSQQECNGCHGITRQHLRYWRALADTSLSTCLTDLSVQSQQSAQQMIDCLRAMPTVADSDFKPAKLGIYAIAARLPWFQYTFYKADGDAGAEKLAAFQNAVAMPRGGKPALTQAQFDIVAEWFARGLPLLEDLLRADGQPTTCDPGISADVTAHVTAMHTTGWRTINAENHLNMFGCGAATDPRQCLADKPLGSSLPYGAGWDVAGRGQLRLLKDVTYHSSYWTRSSPDGRFVAHGVDNVSGSYVIDLQRDRLVPIATMYDPGFFPDNTGFVFQGGDRNVCAMSVLTSNPTSITMHEPACANIASVGLYQHVGRALGGGDFFAIDSEFVSDDGGHDVTVWDPPTGFDSQAYANFTPMMFDGTTFVERSPVAIATPYEGDAVLSPSTKLVISRVAGAHDRQLGYVLRRVDATLAGSTYTIATPEIARYCIPGGKPAFSYDERWIVYHHYVTNADAQELGFANAADDGFQPYRLHGAANLYLMDLTTGVTQRITNMAPGQYALYPHFRSDGWIYADVRDINTNHEYVVASDAALIREQP